MTFGSLVAELTSRAAGKPFTELVRTEVAEPLGVKEFWYEVPPAERARIARTFPHINPFGVPWGATSFAMSRLPGLRNVADAGGMPAGFDALVRNPAIHDSVMPGWNGVFSARALARMYGGAGERRNRRRCGVPPAGRRGATEPGADDGPRLRPGHTDELAARYHAGMVARRRQPSNTFGHYGLGGSGAFADADSGLSIAFVTNRLGNMLTPPSPTSACRSSARRRSPSPSGCSRAVPAAGEPIRFRRAVFRSSRAAGLESGGGPVASCP